MTEAVQHGWYYFQVWSRSQHAIGVVEPVSVNIDCFGTETQHLKVIEQFVKDSYDLTPRGISEFLHLTEVNYNRVSSYGHFGKQGLLWEQ